MAVLKALSALLSPRILFPDRFLFATPAVQACDFEPVGFPAPGGVTLRGWLLPAEGAGTLVFCPGNSGNLSSHLLYLALARRAGFSVLGFDYRGFGQSDGKPDVRFLADDVLAACRFVKTRRGLTEPLALFGVSLGALAALAAAARTTGREEGPAVSAVVAEGVSDVKDLLGGLFRHGRFGPVRFRKIAPPGGAPRERVRPAILRIRPPPFFAGPLATVFCGCYPFEGKRPRRLAPLLREIPVLLVHGVEDEVLPFEAALDLHSALRGAGSLNPARLWLIPGAGHAQEPALSHGAEYSEQLRRFLHPSLRGDPPAAPAGRPASDSAGFGAQLVTRLRADTLEQRVLPAEADFGAVNQTVGGGADWQTGIAVRTLGEDGFPRPELDPLSDRYRRGGYRDAFRRMVRAVNSLDLPGLDSALGEYLALPRELPFDLLASTYCLRIAIAGREGLPGWPRPAPALVARSLERFRELWTPHRSLPGRDCPQSPLCWVERALQS